MQTRRRIIDAATKLISDRGNTNFMLTEVTGMCEISKGAIYYYFQDKDDLLDAVFDELCEELNDEIETIIGRGLPAYVTLKDVASAFSSRAKQGNPLAIGLVRELVQARDGTRRAEDTKIRHVINVSIDLFERAKEEGRVRADVDAQLAAVAICGAFTFSAISVNDRGGVKKDFENDMLEGIIRGIGTRSVEDGKEAAGDGGQGPRDSMA